MASRESSSSSYTPMIYYQKPVLGPTGLKNSRTNEPLQVSFPSGCVGLGVPAVVVDPTAAQNNSANNVIIASGPEESMMDIRERRLIIAHFLLLALVNIIVTCLFFQDATMVDQTALDVKKASIGQTFAQISSSRSFLERINFGFTLFIIIYGSVSAVYENPLGLSIYAISITLNFLLGLSSIPYFLYSLRYFLDTWMLYLALMLRSKLTLSFLNFYVSTNRNHAQ